jgi:hypothetical protein
MRLKFLSPAALSVGRARTREQGNRRNDRRERLDHVSSFTMHDGKERRNRVLNRPSKRRPDPSTNPTSSNS